MSQTDLVTEWDREQRQIMQVIENVERVIVGKRKTIQLSLVALLCGGHVLLEDVPGVGKTMLVKAIAKSLDLNFRRIQFTPDLLPSDVTGVSVYNQKTMEFEFRPGPIMSHVVLADEINRTSPKTQAALLEALEEGNITVDGTTIPIEPPFFVMATQNPIEYEGTFPLPEAQLDRFLLQLHLGYPDPSQEAEMLERVKDRHPIETIETVMSRETLLSLQKAVRQVYVDPDIVRYIVDIVAATRSAPGIYLGASPRGSIALFRTAQALAFIRGRSYVIPDDVKELVPSTLSHRMMLTSEARLSGLTIDRVLRDILYKIPVPVLPEEGRKPR
ncbi:AAA family ATPase [Planifilum fimeticola]